MKFQDDPLDKRQLLFQKFMESSKTKSLSPSENDNNLQSIPYDYGRLTKNSNRNLFQSPNYLYKKKTPVRTDGNSVVSLVLYGALLLLIAFLLMDMKTEYDLRVQRNIKESTQCYLDFQQNEQIVCKKLEECSVRDPYKSVRMANLLLWCISDTLGTFLRNMGIVGTGVILVLLAICIYQPYDHIEEQFHARRD